MEIQTQSTVVKRSSLSTNDHLDFVEMVSVKDMNNVISQAHHGLMDSLITISLLEIDWIMDTLQHLLVMKDHTVNVVQLETMMNHSSTNHLNVSTLIQLYLSKNEKFFHSDGIWKEMERELPMEVVVLDQILYL